MTPSETSQATLTVPADVLFQRLGDEAVALNLASGKYYGFDDVATRMWTLLVAHGAAAPALDALLAEYEVERSQLERDLNAFIERLVRDGLLVAQS
ncbi:MAG: PqqD family protein [Anaerolineae bacterium]